MPTPGLILPTDIPFATRYAIIGNSGSGKSTLAHFLARDAALLDLDTVAFEPDQIAVPRPQEDAVADVRAFCQSRHDWVIEGCYENLIQSSFEFAPTLLFLEPGILVCQENCRNRPWEPHKYASKALQEERLAFLLDWVAGYYVREGSWSLAAHQALFDGYTGPKRKLTRRLDNISR